MFIFASRGIGIAALILGVAGAFAGFLLSETLPSLVTAIENRGMPIFAAGMITAGLITFVLGLLANRKPWTAVIEEIGTGKRFRVGTPSTLYWTPIQYWGLLFIAIGVLNYLGLNKIAGISLY